MGRKTTPTKQEQLETRKYPLLGEPIQPNIGSNETNRGDCCARIFFACMPLLACANILAFLYILIYNGGVNPTEVLISTASVDFEPQLEVIAVSVMGATFAIATTLSRDVQVRVYFCREGTYTFWLTAANFIGSMANTLAYVGFLLQTCTTEDILHDVGDYTFFGLAPIYAILQCVLLLKQTKYSLFVKIVFILMAVTVSAVAISLAILRDKIELQWFAVALNALYTGLFFVLFLVDPVDDELKEFFFFGCCRKKDGVSRGKEKSSMNNGSADVELA